jgi:poly(A) polymerase
MEKIRNKLLELGDVLSDLLKLKGDKKLYLVGGTIRDIILNRSPQDLDFVIEGSGIDFARKFARKINGAFVLLSEEDDEARVVHAPGELLFDFLGLGTKTLHEDLARRDFTINALAVDVDLLLQGSSLSETARAFSVSSVLERSASEPITDLFDGLAHLRQRLIVPVSDDSLKLDPLRLLRAFRFGLELDFRLDERILRQAEGLSLRSVAPERIGYELLRIMEQPASFMYIELLVTLGFFHQIFPEAKELFGDTELFDHSLRTYKEIERILTNESFFSNFTDESNSYFASLPRRRGLLKLAGLFHDVCKPDTEFSTDAGEVHFYGHDSLGARRVERMLKDRLRLSKKETTMVKTLVARHMHLHLLATAPVLTDRAIRRFFMLLADEYFGLMILTYGDGYATAGRTGHLEVAISRMLQLKHDDDAKINVERLVTGDDLIALGLKPGPVFRPILQELEELQLEGKITTKEEGIEYLKENLLRNLNSAQ